MSDKPEDGAGREEFGERLRHLRLARGLTLAACAQMTGLAISTLSKVERGRMALTYDRLLQLAQGLGVDTAELFGRAGARFGQSSLAVTRKADVHLQEVGPYTYEMLFPDLQGKAMTPMTGVVKARTRDDFDGFIRHPGQEFVHVLSGQLAIHTEDGACTILGAGDSLYFDSSLGHVYISVGDGDARILVVCLGERPPDPEV